MKDTFEPEPQADKRTARLPESAAKESLKPIRLHGVTKPEIQANIAAAGIGEPCTVKWQERPDKEGRWLVSNRGKLIGALEADAYKEGQTVILANIEENKKDDPQYRPYVYVK